ncbi:hypothetical protein K437DRAFT_259341 [Tilletiaria anomala UBC 951]|uniref:Fe2OG dioxygenase domain-containing protein n=1 Tax=Tilletiaria anomala (strain ATCC 24038 / CBS 436.72 / UBC 951) TaxID=1037660 RepID=A0A066VIT5_TILAU|nr:uncharacterized protein K437DRAFT_259341 [Tilletiaria anomala UBC 951]KDN38644.1 hypothetical protein K437DRAFT_259341 [Tilletiaria anomala UBC 951]
MLSSPAQHAMSCKNEGGDASDSSLWGGSSSDGDSGSGSDGDALQPAIQALPFNISGLFFFRNLIDQPLQDDIVAEIASQKYFDRERDQVMLFESAVSDTSNRCLPTWTNSLISKLAALLQDQVPPSVHELLFSSQARAGCDVDRQLRQLIVNMYRPGQGIADHVDLLTRFGDGVMICSFLSGIAMELKQLSNNQHVSLWLPAGSVLILTGDARYTWTHGIEARMVDHVQLTSSRSRQTFRIARQHRLSVTIRWMLKVADVLSDTTQSHLRA